MRGSRRHYDRSVTLVWAAIGFLVLTLVGLIIAAVAQGQTLPVQPDPIGGPPTAQEIELGRFMFFNPILSTDGTVSCSSCHNAEHGWSDGQSVAIGIGNQAGRRKSPTLINAGYLNNALLFWDGRTRGTSAQALLPISNPIEMGTQTEAQAVARLNLDREVAGKFTAVFGIDQQTQRPVTGGRLARVIACFQSTIVSADCPADRYLAGDKNALTPDAAIGFEIFKKANCVACHTPPLWTNQLFANNGSEFVCKTRMNDNGRFEVASSGRGNETVRAFKVPTLREIQRRQPYMHHGLMPDLERVIAHYNSGAKNSSGQRDRFTDPRIKPLDLSETEAGYLLVFLREGFAGSSYPDISAP